MSSRTLGNNLRMELSACGLILTLKADMLNEVKLLTDEQLKRVIIVNFEAGPSAYEPRIETVLSLLTNTMELNIKLYDGDIMQYRDYSHPSGIKPSPPPGWPCTVYHIYGDIPLYYLLQLLDSLDKLVALRIRYDEKREPALKGSRRSFEEAEQWINEVMGVKPMFMQQADGEDRWVWLKEKKNGQGGNEKVMGKEEEEDEEEDEKVMWKEEEEDKNEEMKDEGEEMDVEVKTKKQEGDKKSQISFKWDDTSGEDGDGSTTDEFDSDDEHSLKRKIKVKQEFEEAEGRLYKGVKIHDFGDGKRRPYSLDK